MGLYGLMVRKVSRGRWDFILGSCVSAGEMLHRYACGPVQALHPAFHRKV